MSILFIIFVSLFALDVFGEGLTWWQAIAALLIHLIPSYVLVGVTVLAWKKPLIGGLLFVAVGLILSWGTDNLYQSVILIVPPIFTGLMFELDYFIRDDK